MLGIVKKSKCSVGEDESSVERASDGKVDHQVELANNPNLESSRNDQQETSEISESLDSDSQIKSHKPTLSSDPKELDNSISREKSMDKKDKVSPNMSNRDPGESFNSAPSIETHTFHTNSPEHQTESTAIQPESPVTHAALGTLLANYASSDSSEED